MTSPNKLRMTPPGRGSDGRQSRHSLLVGGAGRPLATLAAAALAAVLAGAALVGLALTPAAAQTPETAKVVPSTPPPPQDQPAPQPAQPQPAQPQPAPAQPQPAPQPAPPQSAPQAPSQPQAQSSPSPTPPSSSPSSPATPRSAPPPPRQPAPPAQRQQQQTQGEPPLQGPLFGETIEVRVVNVEAVVTDKQGNRVPDLKPEDFRLKGDGQPIKIDYFKQVRGRQAIAPVPGATQTLPSLLHPAPRSPVL